MAKQTIQSDISLKTWLTRKEAAVYLGLSEKYIDQERKEGRITYLVQKGDSRLPMIRFERTELDRYIRRNYKEIKSVDDPDGAGLPRKRYTQHQK